MPAHICRHTALVGTRNMSNDCAQVAVLDVIWACVVPDRKNTARFLVEDGLDALLSLLEGWPLPSTYPVLAGAQCRAHGFIMRRIIIGIGQPKKETKIYACHSAACIKERVSHRLPPKNYVE
eukprot:1140266-Pelagomonas_calceolata.AAC.4